MAGEMASIRAAFADRFGKDQATAIYAAAVGHGNGINDKNKGDDPFKWALLVCIGYECMSKDRYREHHGITAPWPELEAWIIEHGDLASHTGDCDYLALFSGAYDKFVGQPETAQ